MQLSKADECYIKAQSILLSHNYGDLESGIEALKYALSYDSEHCEALCLLGFVYSDIMMQFDKAFEVFDRVIEINPSFVQVYGLYAENLIWADEFERAEILIGFALKLKGVDLEKLYWCKALMMEIKGAYEKALSYLQKAKKHCCDTQYTMYLCEEEKRVMDKLNLESEKDSMIKKNQEKRRKRTMSIGKME